MTIGRIGMMNYSYRSYMINTAGVANSLGKLSSGYRINSAADDAAGLGISERMRGQLRGLNQAYRNTQQGMNLAGTAEGTLATHSEKLTRMRELAVQAANGTMSDDDRALLNQEFQQLTDEITRSANAANYNGIKLLDGSLGGQKGDAGVRELGISRVSSNGNTGLEGAAKFSISREGGTVSISATIGDETIINTLNAGDVNTTFAFAGGNIRLDFNSAGGLKEGALTNVRFTAGQDGGTDVANAVGARKGAAISFQVGANGGADQRLSLSVGDMTAAGLGLDGLDIGTVEGANAALKAIDRAANTVSAQRGSIGALTNRMEHSLNSLGVSAENTTASESRIRDLDMAWESMQLMQRNMMMQASQAMMAQGMNLSRQNMLGLLMR